MKDPLHHDPVQIIGDVYERILERAMEDFKKAEEKTAPVLHKMIDKARDKVTELEELSKEEADKLSDYMKRDLADAAEYMSETGNELKGWLGFETRLIEDKLLDLFAQAADKTTIELVKLKDQANQASSYHTGEVTGLGTLVCDQCQSKLHFHKPGKIPPCYSCHATVFHRSH